MIIKLAAISESVRLLHPTQGGTTANQGLNTSSCVKHNNVDGFYNESYYHNTVQVKIPVSFTGIRKYFVAF